MPGRRTASDPRVDAYIAALPDWQQGIFVDLRGDGT
jgi:hypothetical protein